MNYPFSVYIPRMSVKHDEDSVSGYLDMLNIGVVSRVDFTPINKKPGFEENINGDMKSAFVHFSKVKQGYFGNGFPYDAHFWAELASGRSFKIQINKDEYWLFLKNNKPVKKTLMNIHQVVENGRHLENLIEDQAKKIEEQAKQIEQLMEALSSTQDDLRYLYEATLENSEQDTAILARKSKHLRCDDSTVNSYDYFEEQGRLVEEQIERNRALDEEDKYYDRQEEANADIASDLYIW
jgi:hypothetical protein